MNINPTTASDAEVEEQADKHARNETRWAWLIFAALLFEAVVIWLYRRDWWEAVMLIAADVGIAAGVVGEIRSGRKASRWTNELSRRSKERVAEANRMAEEARLELAKFRAPRVLTSEQIERIAEKLRPFAGVEYECAVYFPLPEMLAFVALIEAAVEEARWIGCDCSGPTFPRAGKRTLCTGVMNTGVMIGIPSAALSPEVATLARAGMALAEALRAEDFEAGFKDIGGPFRDPATNNRLAIMIGPKL